MLDKTLGYILCCQSPALFLAALALLVAYLAGRKHKVRAFFRLLLCILCAAGVCQRRGSEVLRLSGQHSICRSK